MNLGQHRLCIELQRLDWARELREEIIQEIATSAELKEFQSGRVVIELDSGVNHVYFVVTGRLAGTLFDRLGKEIQRDIFARGSVVGLFYALLPDRSHLHIEAVEPTTVICLPLDELLRLLAKYREFQLTMLRIAANVAKRLVLVDRELPKPAVIGMIHHSSASRSLTFQLARRLLELGECPCVAGDDESWKPEDGILHRLLYKEWSFHRLPR